jgi:hypothetical protein
MTEKIALLTLTSFGSALAGHMTVFVYRKLRAHGMRRLKAFAIATIVAFVLPAPVAIATTVIKHGWP